MPGSKSGGQLVEKFTPSTHKVDWMKVSDWVGIITARENGSTGNMF